MTTTRQPDQLDMQCEMARRAVNRHYQDAKDAAATWEPRHRIDISVDPDRLYADEIQTPRPPVIPDRNRRHYFLFAAAPLALALTSCTPAQVQQWMEWHQKDPAAAEAFANQSEVQQSLKLDWDHDGVIEPDDNTREPARPAQRPATAPRTTTPPRSPQRSSGGSTGRSGVNWDNVARCESGGQWHHPPVTNRFGTFSGGLMIMNSAWRQFGGTQFAPLAYQASREQQIIVAERIAARVGAARAWQCPV